MNQLRRTRVSRRAIAVAALLLLVLPLSGVTGFAQDNGDSRASEISFTMTSVATLDEGAIWGTDSSYHLRGVITEEAIEGDLTGTGVITMDGNFVAAGECTDDFCPGAIDAWGSLVITDEAGT